MCGLYIPPPHTHTQISTKNKFAVHLDAGTTECLENESIKPRHHAGVDKAKCITLPEPIIKSMFKSLKGTLCAPPILVRIKLIKTKYLYQIQYD